MPTFGSLFAGIGGMDLGLERAGWECRWQVESDEWCQSILARHWPQVRRYGDVKELTGMSSNPLTLWPEDSPANQSRSRGRGRRKPTNGGSGPTSPVFLAFYDPDSRCWRTYQGSLTQTEDQPLATFSGTWPRSGSMQSGSAYQRPPLVPLTSVIGSSSWPTPTTADAFTDKLKSSQQKEGSVNLSQAVKMWPTPTASDATGGPGSSGRQGGDNLRTAVDGSLNPTWVEWLQGFPLGWTESEDSVTPSSRNRSSGSDAD